MPHMSPVIETQLDTLLAGIERIRRGGSIAEQKPHKLLMLLAVIHLADVGGLQENKIYFDGPLLRYFEEQYRAFARRDDWCQPGPPFFHLRSSGFWYHKVKLGCETAYARLTTSGGGSKRIIENIEYAYLSEDAYTVICHDEARNQLREFLVKLIVNDTSNRLKTSFHETFPLSRDALRQVLTVLASTDQPLTSASKREDLLRTHTHLGTRYVKVMPRYAVGAGLANSDYSLTPLGQSVVASDTLLEKLDTMWLLHYFMSAPQGPGPVVWHKLACDQLRSGNAFSSKDIEEVIAKYAEEVDGRPLAARSVADTATIYLRTYTKDEGLGRLKILESLASPGTYSVLAPEPPSPWAFGYALLHYWHSLFGDQVTINLDELYREGGLGSIFLCGAGRVNRLLAALQAEGIVDVYRVAPPYQVVLLHSDPQALLQKMYANHDTLSSG
jgi:hypothetical protein